MSDYFTKVTPEKVLPSDYQYLGRLQVKTKGDTVAAIGNLNKAIEMDSSYWTLYKEMGELYYSKKDNCNAATSYQMYQDSVIKPEPTDIYKLGLAQFYCPDDSLRYQKAEKTFLRITELVPTATIGWFWTARAATKLEVDVQANPDSVASFGRAKPYWETYVNLPSLDKVKSKKDVITAYEYLTYYYYLRGDAANTEANANKLLELDPANPTGMELLNQAKSGTMKLLAPGTAPTTAPPATGGKGK